MKNFIILFSILFFMANIFSSEVPEEKVKTFNQNFITIYIHGYWSKCESNDIKKAAVFRDIFEARGKTENDFSGYFAKSTEKLAANYDSIYAYSLSNGFDKDMFSINGKNPENMSDILVREIGDFNYGSQVLKNANKDYNVYKQSLIGLAKAEWVFNQAYPNIKPNWDNRIDPITGNYERLILNFGSFFSLLSYKYVRDRLNDINIKAILGLTTATDVQLDAEAKRINDFAWSCPNRINFVAHSMGGCHLMRYLNGYMDNAGGPNEDKYGYNTDRSDSIYKYYQNYDKAKYEREKNYYNDPNFFKGFESLSGIVPNINDLTVNTDMLKKNETYWNNKLAAFSGHNIDNMDKEDTQYLMFVKERENSVCKVVTEDSPLGGAPVANYWNLIRDLFAANGGEGLLLSIVAVGANIIITTIVLVVACYALVFSAGLTAAVIATCILLLLADIIFIILFAILSTSITNLSGIPLYNFFDPDSDQYDELKPTSPLIKSYKNKSSPPSQGVHSSTPGEPIDFTLCSFGGAPTSSAEATEANVYAFMVLLAFGIPQMYFWVLSPAIFAGLQDYLGSACNGEHVLYYLLNFIFVICFMPPVEGSLVMPAASSKALDIPWLHNNSDNIHLLKTTRNFFINQKIFESKYPFDYLDRWFNFYKKEDPPEKRGRIDKEWLGIHGWAQDYLTYKWYMTIGDSLGSLVFFEDSPYTNVISIKRKNGSTNFLNSDLPYADIGTDKNRDFFHYIFLDNTAGYYTLNNISIPKSNLFSNVYQPALSSMPMNKGLSCNFMGDTEKKPLDYLVTPTYLKTIPVNLDSYYDGLHTFFSINGSYFTESTKVADIDQYATDHSSDDLPSMVFNDKGFANIASPRLKEGFNTITFKFVDPFGRQTIKDMVIMQNLVPPFVKPLYPVMNDYVGSSSFTLRLQLADITQVKPDWFIPANCTLKVDGNIIPLTDEYFNDVDETINVPVAGLSDGNHTINFVVDYFGSKNERTYRFWVDTTAPEINFTPKLIFSNTDKEKLSGFGAYIKDTVPFTNTYGNEAVTYNVDTVYLNNVNLKIDNTIELYNENNTRLGMHSKPWNGWDGNFQLSHGVHTFEADATDRLGNHSEKSTEFIVDNIAPQFVTATFNASVINTTTGVLQFDYKFLLDPWEKSGKVEINFKNKTANEEFTMTTGDASGDKDNTYPITYMSEGANILKDGIYDIAVRSVDELGNKSAPINFNDIVVDMHRPNIDTAYVKQFVIKDGNNNINVELKASESDPVIENRSPSLGLNITLRNQYDEKVDSFNEYNSVMFTDVPYPTDFAFTLPQGLPSGKYYFKAAVTDKNGNTRREDVPFVKDAISPEITFPVELQILDANISLRGSVGDPRWDNSLNFDHYELYYRLDEKVENIDLNNLDSSWKTDEIAVPDYQMSGLNNIGKYSVEDNILGLLNSYDLPDGLVTVLLVAVEDGGYKISTQRTFRILHSGSQVYTVKINIDPIYADKVAPVDFTGNDINITYNVENDINNPVDLYINIKDSKNKIVKSETYLNKQSTKIENPPVINPADKGIFVWEQDGRMNVKFKNNDIKDSTFTVIINSQKAFSGLIIDSDATADKYSVQLLEDNKKIVCSKQLLKNEYFSFSFIPDALSGISLNAIIDSDIPNIYLGETKQVISGGNATIYLGSDYPPINWNGKDNWGRYVENGVCTVTVEAIGNLGGHDTKKCYLDVKTPDVFKINSISPVDKKIQPELDDADSLLVSANMNKSADNIRVEILDETDNIVKTIIPEPSQLIERGNFSFKWNGDDVDGKFCPLGKYSIRVKLTLKDGTEKIYDKNTIPELGDIEITNTYQYDNSIPARIDALSTKQFNGKDLIKGNTDYKVEVKPTGKYYPEKEVKLDIKGKGTQRVQGAPDLDYMAAIRVNYDTLLGQVKFKANPNAYILATYYEYDGWGKHTGTSQTRDYSAGSNAYTITPVYTIITYDGNNVNPHYENLFTVSFFYENRNITGTLPGEQNWKWEGQEVRNYEVGTELIEKLYGSFYIDVVRVSNYSTSNTGDGYGFTVTATFQIKPTADYAVKYYSYCDGIAVMSPDITEGSNYAHPTAFVYKGVPVFSNFLNPFFDTNNIYQSTNLPGDPKVVNSNDVSSSWQELKNVWRKNKHLYFYCIGELSSNMNKNPYAQPSPNQNEKGENKLDSNSIKTRGGITMKEITSMANGTDTIIPPNSSVKFDLTNNGGKFSVKCYADATTGILYPYPVSSGTNIEVEDTIEDPSVGIPPTKINGNRFNNFATPNYHLTNADVIRCDDNTSTVRTGFVYNKGASGYSGLFNWSEVYNKVTNDIVTPPNRGLVNISIFDIVNKQIYNKGTELNPQGVLLPNDVIMPDAFPVNNNLPLIFTPQNNDTRFDWKLSYDPLIGSDILYKENQKLDLNELNRYGFIKDNYFLSFYPVDGVTTDTSMYLIDNTMKSDNGKVLITKETGGQYDIRLKSIDGNDYRGLQIDGTKDISYTGNKINDKFSINITAYSQRQLVPVYGVAVDVVENVSGYKIEYYNATKNAWINIPVYNPDKNKNILTYWDTTGLITGMYSIRLTSKIFSETPVKLNVFKKEVYIGEKYDAANGNGNDTEFTSPEGNVKLIFPAGSFGEDTLVGINPVDLADIKDIVTLPDIAPVGKVIKLNPENTTFTEPVQLQFTYNKLQLQDTNKDILKIYNINSNGELIALDTMKKYIKVNYDENGNPDEVNGEPDDFTYVRVWAILTHFSYYCVLEGDVNKKPVVDQKDFETNKAEVTFTGKYIANNSICVYSGKDPVFIESKDKSVKAGEVFCDNNGLFVFNNIPVAIEGKNYFFFGAGNSKAAEVEKVVVTKDSTSPELVINGNEFGISPNDDGAMDTCNISVKSNENGSLRLNIFDQYGELLYDSQEVCYIDMPVNFNITAKDQNNNPWVDGIYNARIIGYDKLKNARTLDTIKIIVDTQPVYASLTFLTPIISPAIIDGENDSLNVRLKFDDDTKCSLWIIDKNNNEVSIIASEQLVSKGEIDFTWNGKDSNGNCASDGKEYRIKCETIDLRGNRISFTYNKFFTIDNTPPIVNMLPDSAKIALSKSKAVFHYSTNEIVSVDISIMLNGAIVGNIKKNIDTTGDFTVDWDTPDVIDSTYIVKTLARDLVGNKTILPEWSIRVASDFTPPVTTHSIEGTSYQNGAITFISNRNRITLNGSDDISGVDKIIYILNGVESIYTSPIQISGEGDYLLEYYAIDKIGNIETKKSIGIVVDNTPPSILITGLENNIYKYPVTPKINVQDNILDTYTITLNGTAYQENNPITTIGNNIFKVFAIDKVGNVSEKTAQFIIDPKYMPKVIGVDFYITDRGEFQFHHGNLKIFWNKVEGIPDLRGYNCYVNGRKINYRLIGDNNISLMVLHGPMKIEITSADKDRNESKKSDAIEFYVDPQLLFFVHSIKNKGNANEVHIIGKMHNYENIKIEYAFIEKGISEQWIGLSNGIVKNDFYDFTYTIKEEDKNKLMVFRVSAVKNDKIYYDGDSIFLAEKYFRHKR